jgi:hypothetical protein
MYYFLIKELLVNNVKGFNIYHCVTEDIWVYVVEIKEILEEAANGCCMICSAHHYYHIYIKCKGE